LEKSDGVVALPNIPVVAFFSVYFSGFENSDGVAFKNRFALGLD
jgi:hypothetical protein